MGNKDDMSAESEDGQLAAAVLDEYMRGFQERNPQFRVFSAHLHMDEATPICTSTSYRSPLGASGAWTQGYLSNRR